MSASVWLFLPIKPTCTICLLFLFTSDSNDVDGALEIDLGHDCPPSSSKPISKRPLDGEVPACSPAKRAKTGKIPVEVEAEAFLDNDSDTADIETVSDSYLSSDLEDDTDEIGEKEKYSTPTVKNNEKALQQPIPAPVDPSPASDAPVKKTFLKVRSNLTPPTPVSTIPPAPPKSEPTTSNVAEIQSEADQLETEISGLKWLARRKEQEWDQILRMLKQKEERLMRVQRANTLAKEEAERAAKIIASLASPAPEAVGRQNVVMAPSGSIKNGQQIQFGDKRAILISTGNINQLIQNQPSLLLSNQVTSKPAVTVSAITTTMQTLTTKPKVVQAAQRRHVATIHIPRSQNGIIPKPSLSGAPGPKIVSVISQASEKSKPVVVAAVESDGVLDSDANGGKSSICQSCHVKPSEFVCAGCNQRWYCSRECQIKNWDEHQTACGE